MIRGDKASNSVNDSSLANYIIALEQLTKLMGQVVQTQNANQNPSNPRATIANKIAHLKTSTFIWD